MTRKDFEAIAQIINQRMTNPEVYDRTTCFSIADSLARYLSTTNPRFDQGRFMRACGL